MVRNKHRRPDLNNQVHSEFETSVGSHYDVVRDETLKKQRANDDDGPLNQLAEEDAVNNNESTGQETPKLDADPDSL